MEDGLGEGTLMHMCVQSIASMALGSPAMELKFLLICICLTAVCGNLMYLDDNLMRPMSTKGSTQLREDWETSNLSPISILRVPVARNCGEHPNMWWSWI